MTCLVATAAGRYVVSFTINFESHASPRLTIEVTCCLLRPHVYVSSFSSHVPLSANKLPHGKLHVPDASRLQRSNTVTFVQMRNQPLPVRMFSVCFDVLRLLARTTGFERLLLLLFYVDTAATTHIDGTRLPKDTIDTSSGSDTMAVTIDPNGEARPDQYWLLKSNPVNKRTIVSATGEIVVIVPVLLEACDLDTYQKSPGIQRQLLTLGLWKMYVRDKTHGRRINDEVELYGMGEEGQVSSCVCVSVRLLNVTCDETLTHA